MAPTDSPATPPPPDRLNAAIGVLMRREVEARIQAPVLDALGEEFGRERVFEVVRATIVRIAREQGAELAAALGGNSLRHFAGAREHWHRGGALEFDVREEHDTAMAFDVTRCRYAEFYHAMGMPELGALLSCNRDFAMIQGFNPAVSLTRTQTIMQGASHCDFRYRLDPADSADSADSAG